LCTGRQLKPPLGSGLCRGRKKPQERFRADIAAFAYLNKYPNTCAALFNYECDYDSNIIEL